MIEVVRPATQPVGTMEVRQCYLGHVDQLLEEPVVVASRPAFDDRLYLHVLARQELERRSRQRRGFPTYLAGGGLPPCPGQHLRRVGVVLFVGVLPSPLGFFEGGRRGGGWC